ncbi:GtrA family protein [Paenibacillus segetis]|uniref:Polysaccharide biosynthesis protein GtrA n=1 Tax=Paenibacillus segetis TaxID=1325360 RepID=A0ABQ1YWK7_9BACL|nr:GtrA family protein [Paenibacillus segetis]GGH38753.1 polysaccharide biosynthesis protein GtrA [Paenibacillus segetis]
MSVKSLKKPIEQFLKFNLVGLVNTGIDFVIFTLLLWLGVFALLAQCISYAAGTLNSYFMNKRLTFNDRIDHQQKFDIAKFTKFALINLVVLGCSLPLLSLLIHQVGLHPILAKLIVTCGTVIINFFATRKWVFVEKHGRKSEM